MRLSDRISGLLAAGLGLAVLLLARAFPPMPGQSIGPALFPACVGAGLVACGAWLVVADVRRGPVAWLSFDDWVRRPKMVANLAVVVGSLVAYILVVERVGFFVTSVLLLAGLMANFGARRAWIALLSIGVTMLMHYAFYTLLRVPLPWGLFESVAW